MKNRNQLKTQSAQVIKIVPGGPVTETRGASLLGLVNELIDSAIFPQDLTQQLGTSTTKAPSEAAVAKALSLVSVNVPLHSPTFSYPEGFVIRATFAAKEIFLAANMAGLLPAPTSATGDAYWHPVAEPVAPVAVFQRLSSVGIARGLAADEGVRENRLYAIERFDKVAAVPLPTVLVRGNSSTEYGLASAEVYNAATGMWDLCTYNLLTDTVTLRADGGPSYTDEQAVEAVQASGKFDSSDPVWLERGGLARYSFTDFGAASNAHQAGDTLRVRRKLDYGTGNSAKFALRTGVLVIEAGASLRCKSLEFWPGAGAFKIQGAGELLAEVISISPEALSVLEISGLSRMTSRLEPYNYSNTPLVAPLQIGVTTSRWQSPTSLASVYYAFGARRRYVQLTVENCELEASLDAFLFTDEQEGAYVNDTAAAETNLLRLIGNTIKAPADKRVLNDDTGRLRLELSGNTYIDVPEPAQTFAVLLPSDAPEATGGGGPATVGDGTITNIKLASDVKVGSLAGLTTNAKNSVVAAINEVNAKPSGGGAGYTDQEAAAAAGAALVSANNRHQNIQFSIESDGAIKAVVGATTSVRMEFYLEAPGASNVGVWQKRITAALLRNYTQLNTLNVATLKISQNGTGYVYFDGPPDAFDYFQPIAEGYHTILASALDTSQPIEFSLD